MKDRILPGEEHWQNDGEPLPIEVAAHGDELYMYMYSDEEPLSERSWNETELGKLEIALLPFFLAWKAENHSVSQDDVDHLIKEKAGTSRELNRALNATEDRVLGNFVFSELQKVLPSAPRLVLHALMDYKHGDL